MLFSTYINSTTQPQTKSTMSTTTETTTEITRKEEECVLWESDDEEEEDEFCDCDFPANEKDGGLYICRECNKPDHYKNGVIADWTDDEYE